MTVLEMSRPPYSYVYGGGKPHPLDNGSYPASMKKGQLPPIRDLFPFFDRDNAANSPAQPPNSSSIPSLSLSSSSPNTASASVAATPEYTLVQSGGFEARRGAAEDERTARNSHVPRMYNVLQQFEHTETPGASRGTSAAVPPAGPGGESVTSSRRSSSGFGSTVADGDVRPAYHRAPFHEAASRDVAMERAPEYASERPRPAEGRLFGSPSRDQPGPLIRNSRSFHPVHFDQPESSSHRGHTEARSPGQSSNPRHYSPSHHNTSRLQQQQQHRPYHHGGSRQSHGHAATHLPYGSSSYQQHPSRVQSRSVESVQSFDRASLPVSGSSTAFAHQHHSYRPEYAPQEYYHAGNYGGHEMSGHHSSMMGSMSRHRRSSISKSTKKRRGNLPKEFTDMFQSWLLAHVHHPYPSDEEKHDFIRRTGLDMNQVSNWFINARRRKLPDIVRNLDEDTRNSTTTRSGDMG